MSRPLPLYLAPVGLGLITAVWWAPLPASAVLVTLHGIPGLFLLASLRTAWKQRRQDPEHLLAWSALVLLVVMLLLQKASLFYRLATMEITATYFGAGDFSRIAPASLLLVIVMMSIHPEKRSSRWLHLEILDGSIFGLSACLLLWIPMGPALSQIEVWSGVHRWAPLLLFIFTSTSVGIGFHGILRQRSFFGPHGAYTLALAVYLLALLWLLFAGLRGPIPLDHPGHFCGQIAILLVCAGIHLPIQAPAPRELTRLIHALPYFPATLAFLGFLLGALRTDSAGRPVVLMLVALLSLAVLARQGYALLQLRSLNDLLEARVAASTRQFTQRESLVLRTQGLNLLATIGAGMAQELDQLLRKALQQAESMKASAHSAPTSRALDPALLLNTLQKASQLTSRLMSAGRQDPLEASLELGTHVRSMEGMLRTLIPSGITLNMEIAAGRFSVDCTASQIDQLILNLVSNAKDAMPEGGNIRIRLHNALGAINEQGVAISVEDTGSGIPDSLLTRIFDPFFTTKAPGKGTGLGLGSVKAVVEGLGGRLHLRTAVGEGTCFTLWIPQTRT